MQQFTARALWPRTILPAAALGLLLAACAPSGNAGALDAARERPEAVPRTVAFVDVNVVPMDREIVLEAHKVVVEDGRIVSVAPSDAAPVPEGAQRIDGAGRWLMPGLAEMHGHVPGADDPGYAERLTGPSVVFAR